MFLFVYGTLKRGYGNNRLLDNAAFLGTAQVRGFKIYHLGGFPGVHVSPDLDDMVYGELYRVDNDYDVARLDRLEGVNHQSPKHGMYHRMTTHVELYNEETEDFDEVPEIAHIYVYNGRVLESMLCEDGVWNRRDWE